jgi:hypothetical protein
MSREITMTIGNMLSVTAGTGIAVAAVLLLGSLQASAAPANGVALIHAVQKAEPVARYHIPRYKRCRSGFRQDRAGYCVPGANF